MRKVLFVTTLLAVAVLAGCRKTGKRAGNLNVSGELRKDCSHAPVAGEPVEVWFENSWTSDEEPFAGVIGDGVTDAEGRFSIRCRRYTGDGSLTVQAKGIGMCWNGMLPKEDLDLGIAYQKPVFGVSLRIKVGGAVRPSDTLFYCYDEREGPHIVYPIAAEQVVPFTTASISGGGYLGKRDDVRAFLRWAIGRADYEALISNRPVSRPYFPSWQSVPLRRCSTKDTFTVNATVL